MIQYMNKKIREYFELGVKTGLFDINQIDDLYERVKDVEIKENNLLTGDAQAVVQNGKNVILINSERCRNKSDYFMDEVIFHELTHFINEIHRDIYINRTKKVLKFKNTYSYIASNNQLLKYPEWGAILLDESIAQKTAQIMVEEKYNRKIYKTEGYRTKLTEPQVVLMTDFADYPEYCKFATKFAQTVYGGENALNELCKSSFKGDCLDEIFEAYKCKKDGIKDLYEILGYMGNIAIADYASKGHFVVPNSEENRNKQNVLRSMATVNMKLDDLIKRNADFPSAPGERE